MWKYCSALARDKLSASVADSGRRDLSTVVPNAVTANPRPKIPGPHPNEIVNALQELFTFMNVIRAPLHGDHDRFPPLHDALERYATTRNHETGTQV